MDLPSEDLSPRVKAKSRATQDTYAIALNAKVEGMMFKTQQETQQPCWRDKYPWRDIPSQTTLSKEIIRLVNFTKKNICLLKILRYHFMMYEICVLSPHFQEDFCTSLATLKINK